MSKGSLIGVSGISRKIKKVYIGVGGISRKVKKAYIGVNGVAKPFYSSQGVLKSWKCIEPLPKSSCFDKGTFNGHGMLLCNAALHSSSYYGDVYTIDKNLVRGTVEDISNPRLSMGKVALENHYILGGGAIYRRYCSSVECYDKNFVRQNLKSLNMSKRGMSSLNINKKFAVFAGGKNYDSNPTSTAEIYDDSLVKSTMSVRARYYAYYGKLGNGNIIVAGQVGRYKDDRVSWVDYMDYNMVIRKLSNSSIEGSKACSCSLNGKYFIITDESNGDYHMGEYFDTNFVRRPIKVISKRDKDGMATRCFGGYALFIDGDALDTAGRDGYYTSIDYLDEKLVRRTMSHHDLRDCSGTCIAGDKYLLAIGGHHYEVYCRDIEVLVVE